MNPIFKLLLTTLLRHGITALLSVIVVHHFVGADIAQKLMNGDTVSLWEGYSFNLSTIAEYAALGLIAALPFSVVWSWWSGIWAKYRQWVALHSESKEEAEHKLKAASFKTAIKAVSRHGSSIVILLAAVLLSCSPVMARADEPLASPTPSGSYWVLPGAEDTWTFYKDAEGMWRWKRVAPNGVETGASSEGYINFGDAKRNAERHGWREDESKTKGGPTK